MNRLIVFDKVSFAMRHAEKIMDDNPGTFLNQNHRKHLGRFHMRYQNEDDVDFLVVIQNIEDARRCRGLVINELDIRAQISPEVENELRPLVRPLT